MSWPYIVKVAYWAYSIGDCCLDGLDWCYQTFFKLLLVLRFSPILTKIGTRNLCANMQKLEQICEILFLKFWANFLHFISGHHLCCSSSSASSPGWFWIEPLISSCFVVRFVISVKWLIWDFDPQNDSTFIELRGCKRQLQSNPFQCIISCIGIQLLL